MPLRTECELLAGGLADVDDSLILSESKMNTGSKNNEPD